MGSKNTKDKVARQDASSAFYEWLERHPVTRTDLIEVAVKRVLTDWLQAHSEEIIERLTGPTSAELQALREQARKEGRPW